MRIDFKGVEAHLEYIGSHYVGYVEGLGEFVVHVAEEDVDLAIDHVHDLIDHYGLGHEDAEEDTDEL